MTTLNNRWVCLGVMSGFLISIMASLAPAAVTAYWSYDEDIYPNASADASINLYAQPVDANGSNVIDPNAKTGYGKALRCFPEVANLWGVQGTLEKVLPAAEGTVEMWIAPAWDGIGKGGAGVGGSGAIQMLFAVDTGSLFSPGFQIMIMNNGWPADGGQLLAYWNDGQGGFRYLNNSYKQYWPGGVDGTTENWVTGEWHHVAFCWDISNLSLFLDGKVVKRENRPSSASAHDKAWAFWMFGHGTSDSNHPAANSFYGKVDEVVIWDIAKYKNYWQSFTPPLPLANPVNCQQAQSLDYGLKMDINKDCYVNFKDFALLAANWLRCNGPSVAGCTTTWW